MSLSKEEQQQKKQIEDEVWKVFEGRCAGHGLDHPAVCTHHITPRSKSPRNYWRDQTNLIPLCAELHAQVHNEGTRKWEKELRAARKQSLILLELGY